MKFLFIALLFLFTFPLSAVAAPLPLNPYDSAKKEIQAPVYARLRPFSFPQQDNDGAYILAEATAYNEGTLYYVINNHLYMTFVDFSLYIPSTEKLPQLEIITFWQYDNAYQDFQNKILNNSRVHPVNGTDFTLSCGNGTYVKFTHAHTPYSKVTWVDNGKEYPFELAECPIRTDDITERTYAYCKDNILYYDGDEFFSQIPKEAQLTGIFFCDLKNRTRGTYAVKPAHDKKTLWPK